MSTTITAQALAQAYETAQANRAIADGAYLTVTVSIAQALAEGTVSYAALVKATPSLRNVREAQRVALVGESIIDHGMPEGIDPGEVALVESAIGTVLGHYGPGAVDAIREAIALADDLTEAWEAIAALRDETARKRKGKAQAAQDETTGESVPDEGETADAPETAPRRSNGALIADALAAIGRVDASTLTESETLALASLIQAVAALGKASQVSRKAA